MTKVQPLPDSSKAVLEYDKWYDVYSPCVPEMGQALYTRCEIYTLQGAMKANIFTPFVLPEHTYSELKTSLSESLDHD